MLEKILFFVVIMLANIMQGITGFAGTILAMPFSLHLVGYDVAKPVLNFLGVVAGVYVVLGGYRQVNLKQLKRVCIYMACGIAGGILLRSMCQGQQQILNIALGLFVVFIGGKGLITMVLQKSKVGIKQELKLQEESELPKSNEKSKNIASGILLFVAGIVHGIFVSGGPLIISYLTSHTKDKEEFRRTVSAVWIILNTIIFVSDILAGFYTMEVIKIQLISLPFLFIGMFVGGALYRHMSQKVFTCITYILLCLAGISLLLK